MSRKEILWTDKEVSLLKQFIDEGKLSQMEICAKLIESTGIVRTRDAVKNKICWLKTGGLDMTPTQSIPKKEITRNALDVIKFLKDALSEAKPYKIVQEKSKKALDGDTIVIHFADWHVGKEIKDESGNVIYNEKVSQDRRKLLANELFSLLSGHIVRGTKVNDVVIISTGDLVDGSGIYSTQSKQSDLAPPFQVMSVVATFQEVILRLLEKNFNVSLKLVKGNHGEIRESGKEVDPLANWDLMVYLILDYWARQLKNKKLSIEYSQLDYLNFLIQGWKYHIRHIAPIQPETAAGKAKFLGWAANHGFDALVYGHYHHWGVFDKSTIPIFRGGSLTGADEFSEELAEKSDPVQLIWGVSSKRPLSFLYPVDLGRKGKR